MCKIYVRKALNRIGCLSMSCLLKLRQISRYHMLCPIILLHQVLGIRVRPPLTFLIITVAANIPRYTLYGVIHRYDIIKHRKQEVFLDIMETINSKYSSTGCILQHRYDGKIMMKVFLSGMPEILMGIKVRTTFDHIHKFTDDHTQMF